MQDRGTEGHCSVYIKHTADGKKEGDYWMWRRWPWNPQEFCQLKAENKTFSKEKMA